VTGFGGQCGQGAGFRGRWVPGVNRGSVAGAGFRGRWVPL